MNSFYLTLFILISIITYLAVPSAQQPPECFTVADAQSVLQPPYLLPADPASLSSDNVLTMIYYVNASLNASYEYSIFNCSVSPVVTMSTLGCMQVYTLTYSWLNLTGSCPNSFAVFQNLTTLTYSWTSSVVMYQPVWLDQISAFVQRTQAVNTPVSLTYSKVFDMDVHLSIVGPPLPTNISGVVLSTAYTNPAPYVFKFETFSGSDYQLSYVGSSNVGITTLSVLSVTQVSSSVLSTTPPLLAQNWLMAFDLECNSPGGTLDLTFELTWTGIPALNSIPNGLNLTIVLNIVPSQSFCSQSATGGDTLSGTLLTYSDSSFSVPQTGFNLDQFLYFEAAVTDSTFGIHNVTLLDLSFDVNGGSSTSLVADQVSQTPATQYTILTPAANNKFNFYLALNDTVFTNILAETGETLTFSATFATWLVPQGTSRRMESKSLMLRAGSGAVAGGQVSMKTDVTISKAKTVGSSSSYYVSSGSARLHNFMAYFAM